ncbi:hypothetical protein CA51_35810 [Rosistilla oblonga]|uniref:hypothetical protein n=1 Tax=Rosistilla oblonga TaxID=2527990 RepID=UPI00118C8EF3|nr:hypothetical protein [Rosistilla oblonga]QDV13690.1 hypothetical protein CA51_35810 [Rosistilla oblonga]
MLRSLITLTLVMCGVLQLSADDANKSLRVKTASTTSLAAASNAFPEGLIANLDRDGRIQVQLLDLTAGKAGAAGNLAVTLVGVDGGVGHAVAGANGIASLQAPGAGWYSLVVADADQQKHGVLFIYANATGEAKTAPLAFPIVSVGEGAVLQNIRGYLGDVSGPFAPLAGINAYQIASGDFYRVQLASNGTLNGQVIAPLRADGQSIGSLESTNITIIQNGAALKRTTVNSSGSFSVAGLKPGAYGVIAAGQLGYTAFSIEALATPTVQPVSTRANLQGGGLICCLVPASMMGPTMEAVSESFGESGGFANAGPGAPGPAAGGGGMTGGGGGGGGGGDIAALAALGAAAAVLAANDDDDDNFVASPAAP